MRIGIIQFPGSNCERETMLAVQRAQMEPVPFLWNESIEKLRQFDAYIIVGGFSYEDRSRAGIIAALDPVMQELKTQSEKGKPILGICNGAQILVETGLVPGLENNKVGMSLTHNKRIQDGKILGTGYYNAWVHMRLADHYQRNAFTQCLKPADILHIPVAHGEGRFVMTEALWREVEMQGLNVFQYCDHLGNIVDEFPINPNGSMHNIAAVSNKAGNVMAMMPHPERTTNGDAIFESLRRYLEAGINYTKDTIPLNYYPRREKRAKYVTPADAFECVVKPIITDNVALTVENTLNQHGIPVRVKRYVHWEVTAPQTQLPAIHRSDVLFNARKESVITPPKNNAHTHLFLVRAKEDLQGQLALQILKDQFDTTDLRAIKHGILWQIESEKNISELLDAILSTHILFNSYAYDCYDY